MTWHGDKGEVPDEWRKEIIVPLHTSKGNKDKFINCNSITLLSLPGKIYRGVLTERLMQETEEIRRGF